MLKRIPFNNDLIPIGNEKHYEGQQVWSDGRVAYGNVRVPQMFLAGDADNAGFWVNEQGNQNYKLCKKFLKLGRAIGSRRHGDIQCFPCWAEIIDHQYAKDTGRFFFPINNEIGMFEFEGGIVCISDKLLVYDNYFLDVIQAGQRKQEQNRDLYVADVAVYDENDNLLDEGTQYTKENGFYYIYDIRGTVLTLIATYHEGEVSCGQYQGQGKITISDSFAYFEKDIVEHIDLNALSYDGNVVIYVYDYFDNNNRLPVGDYAKTHDARRMFQLAKFTQGGFDAYITAETPDRNQQGDILYSGTFDIHFELVYDSGQGDVVVNNGVHVYDSNSNEIYRSSSNLIFAVNNGVDTFIGYGRIVYEENGTDYDFSIRINVDGRSGTGYLEYSGSYKIIHDLQNNLVAEENANGLEYYYGQGWQGPGSIQERNLTPVEYIGDWSINISGTATSITRQTDITDGTKHFVQNGTTVTFEDNGQTIYQGTGSIVLNQNNYSVSFTGHGDISTESNLIVCDSSTPVAEYASGTITFANGYQIAGTITTSNMTPIRWLCNWEIDAEFSGQGTIWEHAGDVYCEENNVVVAYEDYEDVVVDNGIIFYQDAGWIETTKTMKRSIKSYEVTQNGVQLQQYPQVWEIGTNAELLLPSMNLRFTEGQQQTTIPNDPLGVLSPADWITWPGGVHSCEQFVISQDGQKIWNNGNSENYSGIEDCFSLVYLKNKWK